MHWGGEFVTEKLRMKINNSKNQVIDIEDATGLALRHNPKRAHLLVSKMLGKYIPASPCLIIAGGQLLGVEVYKALGGDIEPMDATIAAVKENLHGNKVTIPEIPKPTAPIKAVAIGYAETATSLGHIVADYLGVAYIHSTRYGNPDLIPYGGFEEAHSHATSHKLLPTDPLFLNNSLPLILIDDELTTGNTIINTIRELHSLSARSEYIVGTLIDCRTKKDKKKLKEFGKELGVSIKVVAVASGAVSYPDTVLDDVKGVIADIPAETEEHTPYTAQVDFRKVDLGGFKHARYGVEEFEEIFAQRIADGLKDVHGKTLVLGIEEFMYMPLQVAKNLADKGVDAYSSSTARGPVILHNVDGYPIKSKLRYFSADGEKRFVYNADGFDTIVVILEPGSNRSAFTSAQGLISALCSTTASHIILIEGEL